jgi:hypothetical protein
VLLGGASGSDDGWMLARRDGAAMMEGEEENMRRSTPCTGKKGPGTGWSFLKAL